MARKRYLSQDEWDDYLDLSDSHSEDFSDLSDSEDDVHALYVPLDTDESSSDEDEEETIVQPPVSVSNLSADSTAVAAASARSSLATSNLTGTSSNSDDWVETACDPPNFPFNENVGLKTNLSNFSDFVDLFFQRNYLKC